jgi:general secretion pathway protein F
MTVFRYEALNAEGVTVDGQIDADGERHAQRLLTRRGLAPIQISAAAAEKSKRKLKSKSNASERILLLREMAVLIEAGIPLADAVQSLAKSRGEADLKTALDDLSRDLRQGQSLTTAMRQRFSIYPSYVHQLVEAGDMTGQLKSSLKDAVAQLEYDAKIASEIRGALTYPAILISAGLAAVLFIFIVVVPRFADMFKGRSDALPTLSRWVLSAGLFVRENLSLMAISLLVLGLGIAFTLRQKAVRDRILDVSLNLPIIGAWLTEAETARWTSMLSTLLGNRIPILKALELARGAIGSPALQSKLAQVERVVRSGTSLSSALDEFAFFPTAIIKLIRVGERAGNLPEMLRSAANLTDENVRQRMKQVLTLIEPAAIVIIGGFVGLIMVAIVMAITSLSQIPI